MTSPGDAWWRDFFAHHHSLDLSQFPDALETDREVAGLIRMLALGPEQTVADVCCGYGRHLARLAVQGYHMVGVDISPMMLELARGELDRLGARATLLRADARSLPLADGSVEVVLNLFNSFGYCEQEADNQQILKEAARVLRPGGQFFLDTRTRQCQILFAPRHQPMGTADGQALVMSCHYDSPRHRLVSEWRRTRTGPVVHQASIRLYGLDELDEMMTVAGLQKVAVYGDYSAIPYGGYQRQLLYLARKPRQ